MSARADNGMDPYTVLGISARAVRGKEDLYKLRHRCKALIEGYLRKRQGANARRVKWAFEQLRFKVSKEAVQRRAGPAGHAPAAAAEPKAGAEARSAAAAPKVPAGPAPAAAPTVSSAAPAAAGPTPELPPEDRCDAIRSKAAARRERTAAGEEDPDTVRRREAIKEKLAVKRMLKQVSAPKEQECKQRVVHFLASLPPGSGAERASLTCPASGVRLRVPGRGLECRHLQCFDLDHHFTTKSSSCPVCSLHLEPPTGLFLDAYATRILGAVGDKVKQIAFDRAGAWKAVRAQAARPTAAKAAAARPAPAEAVAAGAAAAAAAAASAAAAPAAGDSRGWREPRPGEADAKRPEEPPEKPAVSGQGKGPERKASEEAEAAGAPPGHAPEAAASPAPRGEPVALGPGAPVGPGAQPSQEQLLEEAVREEQRRRAKLYHTLRADELVDPMDEANYVVVELPTAAMGVAFRPNPSIIGGAFVEALDENGAAARHGGLKVGDQLVGIGGQLVRGRDLDACIDLMVEEGNAVARLTVFRGTASSLYGKGGASDEWLSELMEKVADGRIEITPPAPEPEPESDPEPPPKKRRRHQRLSISDESASSDEEEDDFSLSLELSEDGEEGEEEEETAAGAAPRAPQLPLPERLTSLIMGAGLDEDLLRIAEALPQLPPDGAAEHLPAEPRALARAVLEACTASNAATWAELTPQDQTEWRRAAGKRLLRAAAERAEQLECLRRRQLAKQQRAALAAASAAAAAASAVAGAAGAGGAAAAAGAGGVAAAAPPQPLLRVQPKKTIEFDRNRTAQLMLRSQAAGHVAFRVRTSAPRCIVVLPCAGTLPPGDHVSLQVCSSERYIGAGDLKFLVQAVAAPSADPMPKERWAELAASDVQEWNLVGRL